VAADNKPQGLHGLLSRTTRTLTKPPNPAVSVSETASCSACLLHDARCGAWLAFPACLVRLSS